MVVADDDDEVANNVFEFLLFLILGKGAWGAWGRQEANAKLSCLFDFGVMTASGEGEGMGCAVLVHRLRWPRQ